jgi:hypothetical protein
LVTTPTTEQQNVSEPGLNAGAAAVGGLRLTGIRDRLSAIVSAGLLRSGDA